MICLLSELVKKIDIVVLMPAFLSFLGGGIVFRAVVINEYLCCSEKRSGIVKSSMVHMHGMPTRLLLFTTAAASSFSGKFLRPLKPDTRLLGSKTAAIT